MSCTQGQKIASVSEQNQEAKLDCKLPRVLDRTIALGFPKIELINRIIGSIIAVYLFNFLVENYQFTGAAWGQSLALIMMSFVSIVFILWKNNQIIKEKNG